MKPKFKIGDIVRVESVLTRSLTNSSVDRKADVTWERRAGGFVAAITGKSVRLEGEINPGFDYGDGEYEPAYLSTKKVIQVWLVRRGMMNKEVPVLEEDLEATVGLVPTKHSNQMPVDEQYRKILREAVLDAPRDERGRWVRL